MILGLLVAAVGILIYKSMFVLHTSNYTVASEKISEPVRMVFLSDLHCRSFGRNNESLIALIAEQKPDVIALVGDMFGRDSSDKEIDEVCLFIKSVTEIAPVYYALGNHESDYISANGTDVIKKLKETSAVLLENEYSDMEIRGQLLRFGGSVGLAYQNETMMKRCSAF